MGSIPDEVVGCFNWLNPTSHSVALELTQPLSAMSIRNLPGGKGQPAHKVDKLTAIFDPIVYKMGDSRRHTTSWTFTACYRDSFTYLYVCLKTISCKNLRTSCFVWAALRNASHVCLSVRPVNTRNVLKRDWSFCNPFYMQSILVHSANCVQTYAVACRRVLTSAPL
jgi:hypothetical protein